MANNFSIIKSIAREGDTLKVEVLGSLTVETSNEFYDKLKGELDGVMTLIIDMKMMAYVTSAGIRSLFRIIKQISAQGGKVIVRNVNKEVMTVFELMNVVSIVTVEG